MRPAGRAAVKVCFAILLNDIADRVVDVRLGAVASRIGIRGFHQAVQFIIFERLVRRVDFIVNGQDVPGGIVRVIQVLDRLGQRIDRVQTRQPQIERIVGIRRDVAIPVLDLRHLPRGVVNSPRPSFWNLSRACAENFRVERARRAKGREFSSAYARDDRLKAPHCQRAAKKL